MYSSLQQSDGPAGAVPTPVRRRRQRFGRRLFSLSLSSAGKMLRRRIPQAGHLMTSKSLWMTEVPTEDCDVLVTFPARTSEETVEWFISRIRQRTDLIVTARQHPADNTYRLYVTATTQSLLKWAELTELPKRMTSEHGGGFKEFTLQNAGFFEGFEDKESFLTNQERQSLVLCMINNLRAARSEQVCGLKLIEGQAIIPKCLSRGIVSQMFPLHDLPKLKRLNTSWVRAFTKTQPLDEISDYFGVKIGIYFAWLGHYTRSLILPSLIGIIYWGKSFRKETQAEDDLWFVLFAFFNVFWSTVYLESWKRRSAELAHSWGTLDTRDELIQEPRPLFKGELQVSAVTGKLELGCPWWRQSLRRYLIGWPLTAGCIAADVFVMWTLLELQFWWEKHTQEWGYGAWTNYFPKILMAFVIGVMENIYKKVAVWLNEFENYRLEESYQNHLIVKLALFQFVNSFASLFYIAFYLQDMERLKRQLGTLLIIRQVVGNVKESLIPFLKGQMKLAQMSFAMFGAVSPSMEEKPKPELEFPPEDGNSAAPPSSGPDARNISQAEIESAMPQYDGTFEDYLEMFIQFGYVILFSSAFPLAAVCALLNNIIEIRSDAFKLCAIFQRPFGQRARNIGTWQDAMEVMGVVGVMVNCALIGMSGPVHRLFPNISTTQTVLLIIVLEHVLLLLKLLLSYAIPDTPAWLQTEIAKIEFNRRELHKRSLSFSRQTSFSSSVDSSPQHQRPVPVPVTPVAAADHGADSSDRCCQTEPYLDRRPRTLSVGCQYEPPLIRPRRISDRGPDPGAATPSPGSTPGAGPAPVIGPAAGTSPGRAPPAHRLTRQYTLDADQLRQRRQTPPAAPPSGPDRRLSFDHSREGGATVRPERPELPRRLTEERDDGAGGLVRGSPAPDTAPPTEGAPEPANGAPPEPREPPAGAPSATTEETTDTHQPTGTSPLKKHKPRLAFLNRTKSLSHLFHKNGSSGGSSRRREARRAEEAAALTPPPVLGELSVLDPDQLVLLSDIQNNDPRA
ncbi:anoctamin-8-like isoform X1 [Amphibalanus amphitrite]|uniref:anoctamin-8-like isoform X1 n=2 Tax=Amphibalanus amphitrite TaxID=1232801 RepID=UPI001C9136ED|nr:anoctamin-8-like isoform X1 [Amphibalanus amphitrite]